jgi:hypothetical protein
MKIWITIICPAMLIAISCTYKKETIACSTANVTYNNSIAGILSANGCVGCHNSSSPSGGVNLQDYISAKAFAQNGKLFGAVNHTPGFKPMPQGGGKINQCEIDKIRAWIDNGTPQN